MDLQIEANRNSALFNTFQQVLDVYNPLLHKARPTIVNQAKHRIRVQPTRWGNTLSQWNGTQPVRFDIPRIGHLADLTLKCAFKIPGTPDEQFVTSYGNRGYAKSGLTTGGLDNTKSLSNGTIGSPSGDSAAGRLDRVYADRLLGFNMIREYTVSSKSRELFKAPGEYLLTRFAGLDADMKEAVLRATTPVNMFTGSVDDAFYAPGTVYQMQIPLWFFFNEHITMAMDVNFSEEVHIDIILRAPSELFYYGNLGNYRYASTSVKDAATGGTTAGANKMEGQGFLTSNSTTLTLPEVAAATNNLGDNSANFNTRPEAWDMSYYHRTTGEFTDSSLVNWRSFNMAYDSSTDAANSVITKITADQVQVMQDFAIGHIRGLSAPFQYNGTTWGQEIGYCLGSTTFAFPDVDNLSESVMAQFEANADFIIQDTDAYRALRAQMFPEGTGLTQIAYNVAHESYRSLMTSNKTDGSGTLLAKESGGSFVDPDNSARGINVGDSTYSQDLALRVNNLVSTTHFFVRKESDMGGSSNTTASWGNTPNYGSHAYTSTTRNLGAHRLYTRLIPIHYFQILAAGRVIYESDGDTQLDLTQSGMYQGTGVSFSIEGKNTSTSDLGVPSSGMPFNCYSINWGLTVSRLENTGCVSLQNLNNPTLRIFFKPDTWAEHDPVVNPTAGISDAVAAANKGVRVDILHEHFNVITINSGNGEITSGLNQ